MLNQEENIIKGFSKIAIQYEELDRTSSLINWMRNRVRTHLLKHLNPNSRLLEINCGSGIDAVFLAKKGYRVHATDIAEGMVMYVKSKIILENLNSFLSCETLPFNQLNQIKNNSYNQLFSNFGGLNCSNLNELEAIFDSFKYLLLPNGRITLVIMPKICIWEMLSFFKGNKKAFRRFKKEGVLANIEGLKVRTYYHSKKQIKQLLSKDYEEFKIENICFFGPTGNRIHYPKKNPLLFKTWGVLDNLTNRIPFLQGFGDYYIISAKLKQ